MAYADFSAALPLPAHPLAKSGYGKRTAPDQLPPSADDFDHLASREAEIAGYVDRLTEGAAIGYKALAANIAAYGQQACARALNRLADTGHLRLIKEHLQVEDNSFRWVTRTYWSRDSRSDAWWKAFVRELRGIDATDEERRARATLLTALAAPLPKQEAAQEPAHPGRRPNSSPNRRCANPTRFQRPARNRTPASCRHLSPRPLPLPPCPCRRPDGRRPGTGHR